MKYCKDRLQPVAFFQAVATGNHTGEIEFRNGQEVEINKESVKQIITCFDSSLNVGTQITLEFIDLLGTRRTIKYHIKENDVIIKQEDEDGKGVLQQVTDWDIVSFEYSDMSWVVEQVALGNCKGTFYDARGESLPATKETVILEKDFPTSKGFCVKNPKNGGEIYFKARPDDFYCVHGQLKAFNIIDFIKEEESNVSDS